MSFWRFLWRTLGLPFPPPSCACTLCPCVRRCVPAATQACPCRSPTDPDRGGLECCDVPRDRVAGWSQQRHVLVLLFHRPDTVRELYPSAGRRPPLVLTLHTQARRPGGGASPPCTCRSLWGPRSCRTMGRPPSLSVWGCSSVSGSQPLSCLSCGLWCGSELASL